MPKSLSYREHKIQFLKNPQAAAVYIETILEEKEAESEFFQLALSHVAEALAEKNMTPEKAKVHREKLAEILSQKGSDSIYI